MIKAVLDSIRDAVSNGNLAPGETIVQPYTPKGRLDFIVRHSKARLILPLASIDRKVVDERGPIPQPTRYVLTSVDGRNRYIYFNDGSLRHVTQVGREFVVGRTRGKAKVKAAKRARRFQQASPIQMKTVRRFAPSMGGR